MKPFLLSGEGKITSAPQSHIHSIATPHEKIEELLPVIAFANQFAWAFAFLSTGWTE